MRESTEAGGKGADDYYVKGELRQGITFYVLLILIVALALALAYKAYEYAPYASVDMLWQALYFALNLAVGATIGIFAYGAFNSFKFLQLMVRNSLRVSPHSFPEVFDALKLAAGRLSVDVPYAFVTQNPSVNAYTVRLGLFRRKKVIALNSGLLRAMDGDELLFIIGHELSHVKYGRWRRFKNYGLPYIVSPQFNEFRCDRGGLVASRNLEASTRALLKLVTGREFIDRVDLKSVEREKSEEPPKVLRKLATHPMIDARIRELSRFHGSPAYQNILNMEKPAGR